MYSSASALCTIVHYRATYELYSEKHSMPDEPTWLERIPVILKKLRSETAPAFLDRQAIEHLFRVRRRSAILLLHKVDCYQLGNALVADRKSVISFLERHRKRANLEAIHAQRQRVSEFLGEARQELSLHTISIPFPKNRLEVTLAGLPDGIRLTHKELVVSFGSAQDLTEKLFTLAQALANDYDTLEATLASAGAEAGEASAG